MRHNLKDHSLKRWINQKSLKSWFDPNKVWLDKGTLKRLRDQDIYENNKEDN